MRARLVAAVLLFVAASVTPVAVPATGADAHPAARGYWIFATDGGVFSFGGAEFAGTTLNQSAELAGMAPTPSGQGYWLVDDDGDVFAHGDAGNFGSRVSEADDISAFTVRPQADGYWTANRTGTVEAFGGAPQLGSVAVRPTERIVAMASTPTGAGYWLAGIDGGVFAVGDAPFLGSLGSVHLNLPVVGMAPTPSGAGYWLVAADGGIFSFGDAAFYGSTGGTRLNRPVVGMAAAPSGRGYWLVASDGGIFSFGEAPFFGSLGSVRLNQPIMGMAVVPESGGPFGPAGGAGTPGGTGTTPTTSGGTPTTVPPHVDSPVATLVGAGDIAACNSLGDEATAKLLDSIPGTVFTTGDNAYESGSATEFNGCWNPSWGRHQARIRPVAGNHEYGTPGAAGYFSYFGAAAGKAGEGWYSYDLGTWHVVVLNSNCGVVGGCAAGSAQEKWLRADLAASPAACTVALWHHPRFSSGTHGNDPTVQPLWNALYDYGADVVLNGHDHTYERFAPQRPDGTLDQAFGIREFVIGAGGKTHYAFNAIKPNSEARNNTVFGVLRLTLRAGSYDFRFVPEAGGTYTDSGSGTCHGKRR
jgi:hypothetical protein